ncbi:MAG TPA: riboflavin synthase [Thermoleophilia bacterium]|nr:riboflavin synthase [Thermoleophilia bacterium]
MAEVFTGIVEEVGRLRRLEVGAQSARLEISAALVLDGTRVGDSILTDGVCLTVTALGRDGFTADAMPETVRRTTLGERRPGDGLNLERALTLQSRLGGHLVTGHIDGVGAVRAVRPEDNALVVTVDAPREVAAVSVPQGSVALDGVSLTLVAVEDRELRVSLIPHTAAATTLAGLAAGRRVNLEADLIGKYVRTFLDRGRASEGLTWDKLAEAGFA